jgi:hypothetical protein
MKLTRMLTAMLLIAAVAASPAVGKDILPDAESVKGENRAFIRADGLACYFCAYGLERFFRKSGKVAAYDMNMEKGIVEVRFIKGRRLLTEKELHQIVYDAGYTPRGTEYELVGKIVKTGAGYAFHLRDTGQELPLKPGGKLESNAEKMTGKTVRIKAKTDLLNKTMRLEPLEFEVVGEKTER